MNDKDTMSQMKSTIWTFSVPWGGGCSRNQVEETNDVGQYVSLGIGMAGQTAPKLLRCDQRKPELRFAEQRRDLVYANPGSERGCRPVFVDCCRD